MSHQHSDTELLNRFVGGAYDAFETLYARHKGGVYRYLNVQLRDKTVVDDVFQEVWSKVIVNAKDFRGTSSFTTWLYTIARHKVIDHVRHISVVSPAVDINSDESGSHAAELTAQTPEQQNQQIEQKHVIHHCLTKLPLHQLDCFLLKEEAGLTAKDIAVVVNAGAEAVKSRLRYAYQSLRDCIELKLGMPWAEYKQESTRTKEKGLG